MRNVIVICMLTGFLIWDGFANDGRYLDRGVRTVHGWVKALGVPGRSSSD